MFVSIQLSTIHYQLSPLTREVKLCAGLPCWIFALPIVNLSFGGRFRLGRRIGFCLFIRSFPESATVGVSLGGFLVLLGLSDTGRLFGVFFGVYAAALGDGVFLRTFGLSSGCLGEGSPGCAGKCAVKWKHRHELASLAADKRPKNDGMPRPHRGRCDQRAAGAVRVAVEGAMVAAPS
jgi:hypothetical protein